MRTIPRPGAPIKRGKEGGGPDQTRRPGGGAEVRVRWVNSDFFSAFFSLFSLSSLGFLRPGLPFLVSHSSLLPPFSPFSLLSFLSSLLLSLLSPFSSLLSLLSLLFSSLFCSPLSLLSPPSATRTPLTLPLPDGNAAKRMPHSACPKWNACANRRTDARLPTSSALFASCSDKAARGGRGEACGGGSAYGTCAPVGDCTCSVVRRFRRAG